MNKYAEEIYNEIKKQSDKSKVSLLRIEGIDSPVIYVEICKRILVDNNIKLIAKLSDEKLQKFKEKNKANYNQAINYLKEHDFIENDDPMTKIRNSSVDYMNEDKKTIILLMGTELVLDKGGLADFYCINPEVVIKKLKRDYSIWFNDIFRNNDFKDEYLKGIHTIFKTIFKTTNIDLIKYSNFIDELGKQDYRSEQELCEEIYFNLSKYWNIPCFNNEKEIPKLSRLKNSKECKLISKAVKFASRSDYKDYLSKSKLNSIIAKIDKYVDEKGIDCSRPFPEDKPVFNSYDEFKSSLLNYINGKDIDLNRQNLLKVDFGVINTILNIKIGTTTPSNTKNKVQQITGEPITVYTKIILDAINKYKIEKKFYPKKIIFDINEITLNNCTTDDEKHNACIDICSFLGGIVNFLNKSKLYTDKDELIEIKYKNNIDAFDLSSYENLDNSGFFKSIKMTEKPSSKVKIIISLENDNEESSEQEFEYLWVFKSYDSWKNTFILLNKHDDGEEYPLFATCKEILSYINCESEDEFFINLDKINIKNNENEIINRIEKHLPESIYEKFMVTVFNFKNFQDEVKHKGFFNTIENTCMKLIISYTEMLKECRQNYDKFTSIEQKYIYLILNAFSITKEDQYGLNNTYTSNTIIPPYHPIMLEKMKDRMNFIKDGYSEVFEKLESLYKKDKIFEIIDKYDQLSNIIDGIEVLQGEDYNLILSNKVYGFYGLYKDGNDSNAILSDNVFDFNSILEDEEINTKELIKISPESNIIHKNIVKYLRTFPYKIDGLNILIINPRNMQFVVAGIHSSIYQLKQKGITININLKIVLPDNRKNGSDYLRYWLDNYFSDDDEININTVIKYVDFKSKKIKQLINSSCDNEDISFIYDIMSGKNISFTQDNLDIDVAGNFKFPMVYIPQPISISQDKRSTVISQFQFDGAKEYTQLINLIKNPNAIRSTYRVIKEIEITNEFKDIIDVIHEKSNWIVCVDEGMDRGFLSRDDRKIIGFSTGEGNFGELNITISAHNDKIRDIKIKLKDRLKNKFSRWTTDALDEAAKLCIERCEQLDGSRLLEALNPNDYEIHSFLAYVLTLQTLGLDKPNDNYILRSLVNLDAHRHWFEGVLSNQSETKSRPDLLLLEVSKDSRNLDETSKIKIKATVIECKMGFTNGEYVDKAKSQIAVGIQTLSENWNPNSTSSLSRYWYNQLYRSLVFSTLNISDNHEGYLNFINKLYSILEGNFEIEFNGKAMCYWINDSKDCLDEEITVIDDLEDIENVNEVSICTAGQLYIQKMLLSNEYSEKIEIEYYDIQEEEDVEVEDIDYEEYYYEPLAEEENEDSNEFSDTKDEDENSENPSLEIAVDNQEDGYGNDKVTEYEEEEKVDDIKVAEGEVKVSDVRVLLGEDPRTKEKIYWEFGNKELNNRHLLISGNSGMGKTYCIQGLLYELAKQGISTVIFDYTDGFTEQKLDPIFTSNLEGNIEELYVRIDKFPINPFNRHEIQIGSRTMPESDVDVANRLSSVFKTVYKFGDQQKSIIYESIKSGFAKYKDSMSFEYMIDEIRETSGNVANTVLSKIMPFIDINPFDCSNSFSWGNIIDSKGKIFIIQLTGFDREIQVMLTELILWDIWNYCVKHGDESRPLPIVLDEAQNLDHKINSPSGKILTEGRKFGIAGIYATQFFKGALDDDEIQRLQQSAQKLYFGPPENSVMEIAKAIDINTQGSKEWAEKLKRLRKGECVTCGSTLKGDMLRKYDPKIIKITSLGDRVNG